MSPLASPPSSPHLQARTDAGVPEGAVKVTDAALAALVEDYARWVQHPPPLSQPPGGVHCCAACIPHCRPRVAAAAALRLCESDAPPI